MFDDILMQMQQQQFNQFVDWSNQTAIQAHQQMVEAHQRRMDSIDHCIDTETNRVYEEHVKRAAELEAANKAEYEKWCKEVDERAKKRRVEIEKGMAEAKALFNKRVSEMRASYENSELVKEVKAHFASLEK